MNSPVYRSYMKYYTGSRLFIYEGPGQVTTLAAIRQALRMKAKHSILEIVSDYYLSSTKFTYSPIVTSKGLVAKDSLLLVTKPLAKSSASDLALLLSNLNWFNSWVILTCSELDYLSKFIKNYRDKTVFTYAGGGATGSVFVKNARASSRKEYYRLQGLTHYRKYL